MGFQFLNCIFLCWFRKKLTIKTLQLLLCNCYLFVLADISKCIFSLFFRQKFEMFLTQRLIDLKTSFIINYFIKSRSFPLSKSRPFIFLRFSETKWKQFIENRACLSNGFRKLQLDHFCALISFPLLYHLSAT